MEVMDDMDISDGFTSEPSDMDIGNSDEELQQKASFVPLVANKDKRNLETPVWKISNRPLVTEDLPNPRSYVIEISDDESDEDSKFIEQIYGPFNPIRYSQPPSESPVTTGSPRQPNDSKSNLILREKEIELLKKQIAEREQAYRSRVQRSATPTTITSSNQVAIIDKQDLVYMQSNMASDLAELRIENENNVEITSIATGESVITRETTAVNMQYDTNEPVASGKPILDNESTDMPVPVSEPAFAIESAPTHGPSLAAEPTIHDEPAVTNSDSIEHIADPELNIKNEPENDNYDSNYDSDTSYHTASGSPLVNEVNDIERYIAKLENNLGRLNSYLEDVNYEKHDTELKVLKLQVRMSMNRDRKSLQATHGSDELNTVGEKRRSAEITTDIDTHYAKRFKELPGSTTAGENDLHSKSHYNGLPNKPSERGSFPETKKGKEKSFIDPRSLVATQSSPLTSPTTHSSVYPPQIPSSKHQLQNPKVSAALVSSLKLLEPRLTPRHINHPPSHASYIPPAQALSSSSRSSPHTSTSHGTPIVEGSKLSTYIDDLIALVKKRVDSYLATFPVMSKTRPSLRPARVLTLDGFTLSMNDAVLDNNHIASPLNPESATMVSESILVEILQKTNTVMSRSSKTAKDWMTRIIESLPPVDEASLFKQERWGSLDFKKTKALAHEATEACPDSDVFRCLFVELSLYCNGGNSAFAQDTKRTVGLYPLGIDVVWQRMRLLNENDPERFNIINGLLKLVSKHKTQSGAATVSGVTTEVLFRACNHHGYAPVVNLLTGKDINAESPTVIDSKPISVFSLSNTASFVQLVDYDLYIIWTTVLYNFVCRRMPESIGNQWLKSLISTGNPSHTKPMFTIDWSSINRESPLTADEMAGAANILLSMLCHFKNKARSNGAKRPLLIAVWRSLQDFLVHSECYKAAGTFALFRSCLEVEALKPDAYDVVMSLEALVKDSWEDNAHSQLRSRTKQMPLCQRLYLSYRLMRSLRPSADSGAPTLFRAGRFAALPLSFLYDKEWIKVNPDTASLGVVASQIDYVRNLYLTALGVETYIAIPSKKVFRPHEFRKATFSWITLMFLIRMSHWFHKDVPTVNMLTLQLEKTRDLGINAVNSEDAKVLIFKYAKECMNIHVLLK